MNELFICQWCGYIEEVVITDENIASVRQCACCSKEEVESLFSE